MTPHPRPRLYIAIDTPADASWRALVPHVDPAADPAEADGVIGPAGASNADATQAAITAEAYADPGSRDAFLHGLFARARLGRVFETAWRPVGLQAAHAREKMLVLAYDPEAYKALGPMAAKARDWPADDFTKAYLARLVAAFRTPAPRGRHVNALQHLAGMLRRDLGHERLSALHAAIHAFEESRMALSDVLAELREAADRAGNAYVAGQSYLAPMPAPLLRATGG